MLRNGVRASCEICENFLRLLGSPVPRPTPPPQHFPIPPLLFHPYRILTKLENFPSAATKRVPCTRIIFHWISSSCYSWAKRFFFFLFLAWKIYLFCLLFCVFFFLNLSIRRLIYFSVDLSVQFFPIVFILYNSYWNLTKPLFCCI